MNNVRGEVSRAGLAVGEHGMRERAAGGVDGAVMEQSRRRARAKGSPTSSPFATRSCREHSRIRCATIHVESYRAKCEVSMEFLRSCFFLLIWRRRIFCGVWGMGNGERRHEDQS